MDYQFRTLIIPEFTAPLVRGLATALDPGGAGMWNTPLSPTGAMPATHFISTGMLGTNFVELLPLKDAETGEILSPGQAAYISAAAEQLGMSISQAQIEGLFLLADVTTQDPHQAIARLGLQIISEITGENE